MCQVEVEAESEEEAIEMGYDTPCNEELLENLEEDNSPHVEEI